MHTVYLAANMQNYNICGANFTKVPFTGHGKIQHLSECLKVSSSCYEATDLCDCYRKDTQSEDTKKIHKAWYQVHRYVAQGEQMQCPHLSLLWATADSHHFFDQFLLLELDGLLDSYLTEGVHGVLYAICHDSRVVWLHTNLRKEGRNGDRGKMSMSIVGCQQKTVSRWRTERSLHIALHTL